MVNHKVGGGIFSELVRQEAKRVLDESGPTWRLPSFSKHDMVDFQVHSSGRDVKLLSAPVNQHVYAQRRADLGLENP